MFTEVKFHCICEIKLVFFLPPPPKKRYKRPEEYERPSSPSEDPCKRGLFCDVSEANYPL